MRDWDGGEHPPPSSRRLRLNSISAHPASSVSGLLQQFLELSEERGAQRGREEVSK